MCGKGKKITHSNSSGKKVNGKVRGNLWSPRHHELGLGPRPPRTGDPASLLRPASARLCFSVCTRGLASFLCPGFSLAPLAPDPLDSASLQFSHGAPHSLRSTRVSAASRLRAWPPDSHGRAAAVGATVGDSTSLWGPAPSSVKWGTQWYPPCGTAVG